MLTLDDFDFDLPPDLIAQAPAAERRASRLLRVMHDTLVDAQFADLPSFLRAGDLLVFNDTRVIKARLWGQKESGGQIEVMVERIADELHLIAQIRASKSPKAGSRVLLEERLAFSVEGRCGEQNEFFLLRWLKPTHGETVQATLFDLIERYGHLPLPPYITHPANAADETRYQTVFARHAGAVAAPTAGLHFDEMLLDDLPVHGIALAWLTLHVGAGTFQPVRVHEIAAHRMHSERFAIPTATVEAITRTRAQGGRVIAVGTTSLRALEAAALAAEQQGAPKGCIAAGEAETRIFITPGFQFRVVDALLTNFHLPKSTLLMLVSAFAGSATIRAAYQHAIGERYRFFSYGDAMFLERNSHAF